jgi:hypothetical protein
MYTYALLKTPEIPLKLPIGMVGELHLLGTDELSALVEPALLVQELQGDDDRLMQAVLHHDRVLQIVFRQTPILPLRFGTQFISAAALVAHLTAECDSYLAILTRLAGKAEYTLKCHPQELPGDPIEGIASATPSGRDYFLAKKKRYQAQQAVQEIQRAELAELYQTIAQQYPIHQDEASGDGTHRWHILAPYDDSNFFTQAATWHDRCPHWQLFLSEALPPYHFVHE